MHAWYWTSALEKLNYHPIRIRNAYQDAYLEAAGLPVNVMEILALTQVFESRCYYSIRSSHAHSQP